jgi:hypothetical protein
MKFMATENWFWHGRFYEAAHDRPHIFDFPAEEVPNIKWYPLDEEAEAALQALAAKVKEDTEGRNVLIPHKLVKARSLPDDADIEKIHPAPVVTDEPLPEGVREVPQQQAMSEMQGINTGKRGKRPSDKEPI